MNLRKVSKPAELPGWLELYDESKHKQLFNYDGSNFLLYIVLPIEKKIGHFEILQTTEGLFPSWSMACTDYIAVHHVTNFIDNKYSLTQHNFKDAIAQYIKEYEEYTDGNEKVFKIFISNNTYLKTLNYLVEKFL